MKLFKRTRQAPKPTQEDYASFLNSMAAAQREPLYDVYMASCTDVTCGPHQSYQTPIKVRHRALITDEDITMLVTSLRGAQYRPVVHSWKFVWSED